MSGAPGDDLSLDFVGEDAPQARPARLTPAMREEALIGARSLKAKGFHVVVSSKAPPPKPGAPRHILIVEDDPDTARLAARAIERSGYKTYRATTATETGQLLVQHGAPRLILLDVELPGTLDGFEMLARLRAHATLSAVPVVLFTARSGASDVIKGLKLGAHGYVAKPVTPATLREVIETVLG